MKKISFNRPFLTGKEKQYLEKAVANGMISGNGEYTKMCHSKLVEMTGCKKALLTTSCTDALEMAAILIDINPGDEVIIPSFTFVSTANAFILRGAKVVFVDSRTDHPGMDESAVEALVTEKTKAIVCVHYAGVACDMQVIMEIAKRRNLFVVEDAAQAIDSYYTWPDGRKQALGSIGNMGTLSFHETKNIQCGEGGALLINDEQFCKRAEIIWEKGTNRAAFWRGEIDKYGWVDIGSSFLPSELSAAFLFAQLEQSEEIQRERIRIWDSYDNALAPLIDKGMITKPHIPAYATNNAHMYYLVCKTPEERASLISYLKERDIHAVFHYLSLHSSPYFHKQHDGRKLVMSDSFSDRLVRLPLHMHMSEEDVDHVIATIIKFYS
ncbi:MAG: dTDP-4-amino-4,6-dideoxygalactose transaminase [Flavobacteriales bacterium]|nr:dTDP-4-amino-4,6-dideoxygalactose transaminase [Flavobacteriales bacterium]MCB9190108.1 dTDP-4-amino-4,6-dideoxygalactose transaminase [Flavobacteriales bacterium]MCB9205084.1 dTDP-4-amino-4,6-dideoxygalactose transaminase [Flavobacteriales bacterium]